MKLVALGIVGAALLVGCAGGAPKAQTPNDTLAAVDRELSHTIGTTSLTGGSLEATRARPAPMANEWDDVAGSLARPEEPAQTWGTVATDDPDLAKNPYDPN